MLLESLQEVGGVDDGRFAVEIDGLFRGQGQKELFGVVHRSLLVVDFSFKKQPPDFHRLPEGTPLQVTVPLLDLDRLDLALPTLLGIHAREHRHDDGGREQLRAVVHEGLLAELD